MRTIHISLSLLAAMATFALAAPVPLECYSKASGLSIDDFHALLERHGLSENFENRPRREGADNHKYPTPISELREPLPTTVLMGSSPTAPPRPKGQRPAWASRTGDEDLSKADEQAMARCWQSILESQEHRRKWDDLVILFVVALFVLSVIIVEITERLLKISLSWIKPYGNIKLTGDKPSLLVSDEKLH